MKETSEQKLLLKMKIGRVYRRKDLERYSKSIDRDLAKLCHSGALSKLSQGIYVRKEESQFGPLPPDEKDLVRTFLGDSRFLIISRNSFNSLGLGLTQLSNETVVYNRKRHLKIKLGSRVFVFKTVREFPANVTKEFLLIDLLNSLDEIGESEEAILSKLDQKIAEFDAAKLEIMAKKYGNIRTRKIIECLYE